MFSPLEFRKYAGWPVKGTPALGILVLTRDDQQDDERVIEFRAGEGIFIATILPDLRFTNSERFILGESQKYIEFGAMSTKPGTIGNISAHSFWASPYKRGSVITGLTLSNPSAFTNGSESSSATHLSDLLDQKISDEKIQIYLDISKSVVLDMLGFDQDESLPDHVRIYNAVNFLCLFYLENQST